MYNLKLLISLAYSRGLEDGMNGYPGPDVADLADLITQVPVQFDSRGFIAKATRNAEKSIADAYSKGYAEGKAAAGIPYRDDDVPLGKWRKENS